MIMMMGIVEKMMIIGASEHDIDDDNDDNFDDTFESNDDDFYDRCSCRFAYYDGFGCMTYGLMIHSRLYELER